MASVWDEALAEWDPKKREFVRESFAEYRKTTSVPNARTLTALSLQDFEHLPAVLREQNVTVLRLGRGRFALIRLESVEQLRSLFLFDSDLWRRPAKDIEPLDKERLAVYSLVNRHSETNLINLALASGALALALGLDDHGRFPPVATAQSVFSFAIKPVTAWDLTLDHTKGQVEVDGMFVARLGGRRALFVVEGKTEKQYSGNRSLYKTKLAYSARAASAALPVELPVIPVYLRASRHDDVAEFRVCRCRPVDESTAIDGIVADHCEAVRFRVPDLT